MFDCKNSQKPTNLLLEVRKIFESTSAFAVANQKKFLKRLDRLPSIYCPRRSRRKTNFPRWGKVHQSENQISARESKKQGPRSAKDSVAASAMPDEMVLRACR
jgi:hypothetical protein